MLLSVFGDGNFFVRCQRKYRDSTHRFDRSIKAIMRFLRPYSCTYCKVYQTSLDTLRRHVLRHRNRYLKSQHNKNPPKNMQSGFQMKVMEHQCTIGKRFFSRRSTQIKHNRTHTNEKPYKCEFFCQKCFSYRSNL